uniref:Transmembrane protein n=1 Tax=Medicago truncatula TaxID=3880 RepID=I3S0M6_MEDTR|nr:unknown [Medicago truncatula]
MFLFFEFVLYISSSAMFIFIKFNFFDGSNFSLFCLMKFFSRFSIFSTKVMMSISCCCCCCICGINPSVNNCKPIHACSESE